MEVPDPVAVSYVHGHAVVQIGDRRLAVDRRDDTSRAHSCPVELVTAALGS
jgi:hypothetical protein